MSLSRDSTRKLRHNLIQSLLQFSHRAKKMIEIILDKSFQSLNRKIYFSIIYHEFSSKIRHYHDVEQIRSLQSGRLKTSQLFPRKCWIKGGVKFRSGLVKSFFDEVWKWGDSSRSIDHANQSRVERQRNLLPSQLRKLRNHLIFSVGTRR